MVIGNEDEPDPSQSDRVAVVDDGGHTELVRREKYPDLLACLTNNYAHRVFAGFALAAGSLGKSGVGIEVVGFVSSPWPGPGQ